MSKNNLSSNNEPLVKLSPKRKRTRASARLQQVHEEKGQVDNTPSGGLPDLSEPLGHEAPTSTAYIGVFSNSKTNQPFKKQLIEPETNDSDLNTSHIENRLHTNQNNNSLNTYTNCSQQAIEDDSKKIGLEGKNKTLGTKFNPNYTEDL